MTSSDQSRVACAFDGACEPDPSRNTGVMALIRTSVRASLSTTGGPAGQAQEAGIGDRWYYYQYYRASSDDPVALGPQCS